MIQKEKRQDMVELQPYSHDDRARSIQDPLNPEKSVAEEAVENIDMETAMVEYIDWKRGNI